MSILDIFSIILKIIIISIVIVLLVVGIVIGAFIIHNNKPVKVVEETLEGGNLSLTYSDEQKAELRERITKAREAKKS